VFSYQEARLPVTNYSKYQQNIIKNYYDNRDSIALQRVQELVTELYLSTGKKRQKYWEQISVHLGKLGVKPAQIERYVAEDKPELIANLVKTFMEKT
jgi:hypothetical protein